MDSAGLDEPPPPPPNMHYTLKDQAAGVRFVRYDVKLEAKYLDAVRSLISKDLSEPYSIYVYRYFLFQWAEFCWLVRLPIHSFIIRSGNAYSIHPQL
jgi:hypothetical protein